MEQAIQLPGAGEIRRYWGWYLALGIVLIVLGTIAIGSTFVMTIASVFFFGWLLIIGGVMEAVHAFWHKRWAGFFLDLLTGILYVVAGWMMVVLFNGVISLILGVMIWWQWPYSGLWVIGLFVGIEMLLNGWSLVMLSLMGRRLPEETLAARGPWRPQSA
jgi:uncharacterized membrane protein HdeD (DUF308 family)